MAEFSRKDLILKLIVEHFIKTAEPVSSQTLIDNYGLNVSSATIRNEMVELENSGFIEKTHTSSGRVPSADGYRYYVNKLRKRKLDDEIRYGIQRIFDSRNNNIEEVIKQGCEIISQMTNLTIVMLGKDIESEKINKIQLLPINKNSAVCVFICESGNVATKNFNIPSNINYNELETCIKIFNERLIGSTINEMMYKLETIRPLVTEYIESFELLFQTLVNAFVNFEQKAIFGQSKLLEQPEFSNDINKVKRMFDLLESKSVWNMFSSKKNEIEVNIAEEDDSISVIKTNIHDAGSSIAIIGPTRMDYDSVIESFEYLKQKIVDMFKERED